MAPGIRNGLQLEVFAILISHGRHSFVGSFEFLRCPIQTTYLSPPATVLVVHGVIETPPLVPYLQNNS